MCIRDSIDTHCESLDRVLSRLHEYGITVKFKKSEFLKEQVNFLGHIISAKGISTDPKKVEIIQNFPIPKNVKQLSLIHISILLVI